MISYLGWLVQFSPAAGRAGRCRQMSLCVGSTRCVLARQPEVLAPSPRVRRAFSPRGGQPRQPEVRVASPRVRPAFSLRGERPGQPGACVHSPPGAARLFLLRRVARAARGLAPSTRACRAFSLRGPSARRRSGLRKSSDRNRGLFAAWVGVASLGLSLPLPLPLPPTSSGDGAALLWSFSVPLFCEPPAVCSGPSIFLSLSHSLKKSPSDCSQGLLAGPYPKECRRLLSAPPPPLCSPPLAGGGCGRLGYFSAGSCF